LGSLGLAAVLASLTLPKFLLVQLKTPNPLWVQERSLLPRLLESLCFLPLKLILGPEAAFLFKDLSRGLQGLWVFGGMLWGLFWAWGLFRFLKMDQVRRDPFVLLLFWIAMPIAILLGADLVRHSAILSISRYFAWMNPALMLLIASGLLGLRRGFREALSVSLAIVMAFMLTLYYQNPIKIQDWKGLSTFLQSQGEASDLLLFNQVGRPLWVAPLYTLCVTYYEGTQDHPLYLTGSTLSPGTKKVVSAQKRFWLIPQNRFFDHPGPPFRLVLRREFKGIGAIALFEKEND